MQSQAVANSELEDDHVQDVVYNKSESTTVEGGWRFHTLSLPISRYCARRVADSLGRPLRDSSENKTIAWMYQKSVFNLASLLHLLAVNLGSFLCSF